MPILAKKEIISCLKEGKIIFEPNLDQYQLQPHSVDLRLGCSFYIPKKWKISEKGRVAINFDYLDDKIQQDNFDLIKLKLGQYFEILPGEFIVASSLEKIILKDEQIMATLNARSSFLRRGLFIASGTVDVKYQGMLTFPIINNTDTQIIKLYPGERICHLTFETLTSSVSDEEAKMHGLKEAKYLESTPYGLESRVDDKEEISLIKEGKIEDLKDKYKIN
ncbi:dCTP deaminase [Candidatus Falkowbacteria bacterium]|nr:dCTP deaminase [Candidatus Falkowbacteria bacterium]